VEVAPGAIAPIAPRKSPGRQGKSTQPLIHHGSADPISAVFRLRYLHVLMRRWAVSWLEGRTCLNVGMRPVEW